MTTQGTTYQIMPDMTEEQFQELKESIKKFGVLEPLEFDEDGNLIDGHHRMRAFIELFDEGYNIPMFDKVTRKYATEEAKIDHIIAFNVSRRHLTPEQRAELVVTLRKRGYTLTKIAGLLQVSTFTVSNDLANQPAEVKQELANVVIPAADGRTYTGAQPAQRLTFQTGDQVLKRAQVTQRGDQTEARVGKLEDLTRKWDVKPGDVFDIPSVTVPGQTHRIVCGDALDDGSYFMATQSKPPRLVITSPPYNQNIDTFKASGMQTEGTGFVDRMRTAYQDSLPEEQYQAQQILMLQLVHQYTASNASFFYNHKLRYRDRSPVCPLDWLLKSPWVWRSEIIWDRGSGITLNARMFIPADERIYWLYKGSEFLFNDVAEVKAWSTVWKFAAHNEADFSAAFPNELPYRCIVACSEIGDAVLDPYLGSGTTMVVAEQNKRICYGIEKNPNFVAGALERLANLGLRPH